MKSLSEVICLPDDVNKDKGSYTSFIYTVADSPSEGQVITLAVVRGDEVTDSVAETHHATLKHLLLTGFNSYAIAKH